jgi:hypothetical protein
MIFRLLRLLLSDSNVFEAATKPSKATRRSHRPRRQPSPSASDESEHYYQGYYAPKFPEKYRGDAENIIFRSSWEKIAFQWCDLNPRVVAWASEELEIEYFMKGGRYPRRYYPDLLIYFGRGETLMIEIKPSEQKQNPNYKNRCKWAAARAYCGARGWTFRIWDEKTIAILRTKVRYWYKVRSAELRQR